MTGDAGAPASSPTWSTAAEAFGVATHRPYLTRTVLTALVIGTLLFAINQLDAVIAGTATAGTWLKVGLTYLVPFSNATFGLLVGTRRRGPTTG